MRFLFYLAVCFLFSTVVSTLPCKNETRKTQCLARTDCMWCPLSIVSPQCQPRPNSTGCAPLPRLCETRRCKIQQQNNRGIAYVVLFLLPTMFSVVLFMFACCWKNVEYHLKCTWLSVGFMLSIFWLIGVTLAATIIHPKLLLPWICVGIVAFIIVPLIVAIYFRRCYDNNVYAKIQSFA